jgi:hypothetical protein
MGICREGSQTFPRFAHRTLTSTPPNVVNVTKTACSQLQHFYLLQHLERCQGQCRRHKLFMAGKTGTQLPFAIAEIAAKFAIRH